MANLVLIERVGDVALLRLNDEATLNALSPAMADELLLLVLQGVKTATCWAASQGLKGSQLGARYVVLNGAGTPRAIIEEGDQ